MAPRLDNVLVVGAGLAGAIALKRHYSLAEAEELGWILRPTAALVEWLSGHSFAFEPKQGYVNTALEIAITPACAGVNFLIIAGLTLVLGIVVRLRGARPKLYGLALCLGVAYTTTLAVNAVRILVAMQLAREHRVAGVLLYLTALCFLYLAAQSATRRLT